MRLTRRTLLSSAALLAVPARALADGAPPPQPASITCGVVLPLSGMSALQGNEVQRGIELAAAAVNQAGGIGGQPLSLALADAPGAAQAGAAVNGLVANAHAALVLGSASSAWSFPASAAAEIAGVPFIELTAMADGICARGFHDLLRTGPASAMAADLVARTLAAKYTGRTIGLLYNTGADGLAFAQALQASLAAAKLSVQLAVSYPEDQADLFDEAGRLMRANVDVLVHAARPDGVLGLHIAAGLQGWRPGTLIGFGSGYGLRDTAKALGAGFDGTFYVGAPFYAASGPSAAVHDAYLARYGVPPRSADSLTAYVGARLVLETLARQGGDATKLLSALRALSLPTGALANGFGVSFDLHGQNNGAFVALQQWRGGALIPV
ncbi:ABC transporter substrate-binding protein [Acidocella sp.]|uniref:ABC transporter substrate-binding protein n=1 Tax=Acidocella sp. TaxID=50710 RepID=UPI002606F421|nr:ABC transporter substrate-binding protein [Acidocella sp.]